MNFRLTITLVFAMLLLAILYFLVPAKKAAKAAYDGQLTEEPKAPHAPQNLFATVPGAYGVHGRFDARAKASSPEFAISQHRYAVAGGLLALGGLAVAALVNGKHAHQ